VRDIKISRGGNENGRRRERAKVGLISPASLSVPEKILVGRKNNRGGKNREFGSKEVGGGVEKDKWSFKLYH